MGDIIAVLNSSSGHVEHDDTQGDLYVIQAYVPMAQTFGYATRLRSITQGRATYSMEFHQYREVSADVAAEIVEKAPGKRYG